MRILFHIDNLSTGGAQRQMVGLALGLKKRGHEVVFFCYSPGDFLAGPLLDVGIPITSVIKQSRFSAKVIFTLRNVIKNGNYDLILSYLPTPNFYAIAARCMVPKKPRLVVSERNNDVSPIGIVPRLVRQTYRFADYLVVNSYTQYANFVNHYPWLNNRISTIYNGFNLEVFSPSTQAVVHDPLKIIVIASALPRKNGLCLIEALRILRSDFEIRPQVSWVGQNIIHDEKQNYYQRMIHAIELYNLNEQWNWLGQRNDIVALLQQHDVLVLPSFGEGLPNVVCEALACGRPVIVSDTLDHPHLVQNGISGYLFDWQDPRDFARCIKQFNDLSIEDRRLMGEKGRLFAEANLSIERMVDQYEEVFNRILP